MYVDVFRLCVCPSHITRYMYFFRHKVGSLCRIAFSLISTGSNYMEVCRIYVMLLVLEFNVLRTLQESRQSSLVAAVWLKCKEIFSIANEILCLYRVDHNFRNGNRLCFLSRIDGNFF